MKNLIRRILKEEEESEYYKISSKEYVELMKLAGYNGEGLTRIKKFQGKPLYIEGDVNLSRTPTTSLGNVVYIDGRLDISNTSISSLGKTKVKSYVSDYNTPIEKKRLAQILRQRQEENNVRRESGEWDLKDTDDEGEKANAVFQYLVNNGDIVLADEEEKEEYERIQNEIKRLTDLYDKEEDPEAYDELYDRISELEDKRDELQEKMVDVYVLSPMKYRHYGLQMFEPLGLSDLRNHEYTVGTESEMDDAVEKYAENYIDDLGLEGFNQSFLESHIDENYLKQWAEQYYEDDVRNNPDVYFNEDDFQLTDEQESRKEELEEYIEEMETLKSELEDQQSKIEDSDSDEYDEIQEKIDEVEENIEKAQDELDSIEPDNEPTEEMIERAVSDRVDDVMYDPIRFIRDYGLDLKDFLDEDSMRQSLIDEEGWGMMNSYDGNYDSVSINGTTYYIMRVQ